MTTYTGGSTEKSWVKKESARGRDALWSQRQQSTHYASVDGHRRNGRPFVHSRCVSLEDLPGAIVRPL